MRKIVNAMFYINRSGCQWDMLPHDLPPKSSVYATSPNGATTARGKSWSMRCGRRCGRKSKGVRPRRVPEASTVNR